MSDNYRPPSGPRGPRGPPSSNYKGNWRDQNKQKGPNQRRQKDRDVYIPGSNDRRRGQDDRYDAHDYQHKDGERGDRNDRYNRERDDRSDRPSGPSAFSNRGQKRGPPSRGGYKQEDRPNKRRDFSSRDYDQDHPQESSGDSARTSKPTGPSTHANTNGPTGPAGPRGNTGPRQSLGPQSNVVPRPGAGNRFNNGPRPSGPRSNAGPRPNAGARTGPGSTPSGPAGSHNAREKPKLPNKRITPAVPPAKKPQQRLQPSQLYSVYANRTNELYKRVQQVGEGTYGKVYKAKNSLTEEYVALKRLRLESEREGFPITAMREIKLLQSFDHPNIVGLLEMMVEHNQIFMILDYMDHDLTGLLTHPDLKLTEGHRKMIFKQLMEGMNYLHKRRVIHRDIKGSNILLNRDGIVKLADFGLARSMKIVKEGESPDYTNRVITIWYRPPELLLGSVDYGREVDIWGVGCLLVELYSKMAIFQGTEEISQLAKIFDIMGTPTADTWVEIENLPWFEMLKPRINKKPSFEKDYKPIMSEQSFDLAQKMLSLVPSGRVTAEEALQHAYFTDEPKPEPLDFMKNLEGEWHEFETKKRRREERKKLADAKNAKGRDVSLPPTQPGVPNLTVEHSVSRTPFSTDMPFEDVQRSGDVKSTMDIEEVVNQTEPEPQAVEGEEKMDVEKE